MHHATAAKMPLNTLALVLPCFNEEHRLDQTAILSAMADLPWLRLVLVNDGSSDGTARVLEQLASQLVGRASVISLPDNKGKAEAVRIGLLHAMEVSDYCGFWDADLAAPLSELNELRRVFDERPQIEWVWGVRLRALGREVTRRASRHYLGRLFATASSILLDVSSYDTQCGAKLFRTSDLLRLVLSEPFSSRWIFDLELLVRARVVLSLATAEPDHRTIESVVFESPLGRWQHRAGSKVRPTDFARALLELLELWRVSKQWSPTR